MDVPRLARGRVSEGPAAAPMVRVLHHPLRDRRDQQHLLPLATAGDSRAVGRAGAGGIHLCLEARAVRLASNEAAGRSVMAAEPSRPCPTARTRPRTDARAVAAALEPQR